MKLAGHLKEIEYLVQATVYTKNCKGTKYGGIQRPKMGVLTFFDSPKNHANFVI